jgi:hypothetical protein
MERVGRKFGGIPYYFGVHRRVYSAFSRSRWVYYNDYCEYVLLLITRLYYLGANMYEYKVLESPRATVSPEVLSEHGEEGWLLTSVVQREKLEERNEESWLYYFYRVKPEPEEPEELSLT